MSTIPATATPETVAAPPAKLDDVMLAMDVVDTLRHRELLVEQELNENVREEQLVERLRALYRSQGIEVPDSVILQGVKALKEQRFVYIPAPRGLSRTIYTAWVKRGTYGKWFAGALAAIAIGIGGWHFGVTVPRERAAEAARIELTQSLPRQLQAAVDAVRAEAQVEAARQRAEQIRGSAQAALQRGNAQEARTAIGQLDELLAVLRQEYTLRIAGRPEDDTGVMRTNRAIPGGRGYYLVVDALDPRGNPVRVQVRNEETNAVETVSRFAVRVPLETFNAVRADKQRNGIVQNARLAEKRRGFLEPEFRMQVQEGRITRW